jgi:hypothetical protein
MPGRIGDLTTLANVKAWRDPAFTTNTLDSQLQREITACSQFILNRVLERTLMPKVYTEIRNGNGQCSMTLRNRPLITVSSVIIGMCSVPPIVPSNPCAWGFTWDQTTDPILNTGTLYLRGYDFCDDVQNVTIGYTAGFLAPAEQQTPDSSFQVQCSVLSQLLSVNWSVAYASSGVLLTPVASAPAVGQYIPPAGPDGFYQFNSADNVAMNISYGYTPQDVQDACIITVINAINRRGRIGERSKTLAGETTAYDMAAIPTLAMDGLREYRRVEFIMP